VTDLTRSPLHVSGTDLVTSAPSVAVFRSRLKTYLFNISYLFPCEFVIVQYMRSDSSCFGHYNLSCLAYLLTYLLAESHYLSAVYSGGSLFLNYGCSRFRFSCVEFRLVFSKLVWFSVSLSIYCVFLC